MHKTVDFLGASNGSNFNNSSLLSSGGPQMHAGHHMNESGSGWSEPQLNYRGLVKSAVLSVIEQNYYNMKPSLEDKQGMS
jgi:hypothetical protein